MAHLVRILLQRFEMSASDFSALSHGPEANRSAPQVPHRLEPTPGTGARPEPGEAQVQASVLRGSPHSELEAILGEVAVPPSSSGERGLITVDELERRYIERVLAITSGNKSRAAQILGFDRRTLYRKIERYGRTQ